jgi:hypothetical protein
MKNVKKLLSFALMSFGSFASAMDHGDLCMSAFYYKNRRLEKVEGLNHKPFSDENNKLSPFVVRSVSTAFLKSLSSDKLQELKSQK